MMKLSVEERAMLNAANAVPPVELSDGSLAIAISPTRGAQLARVMTHVGYGGRKVLVRQGGPLNYLEEVPDVLADAKPFLVVDWTASLVRQLRKDLQKVTRERDEALRELAVRRATLDGTPRH